MLRYYSIAYSPEGDRYGPSTYSLDLFGFFVYPCTHGERRLTTCFPAPFEGTETTGLCAGPDRAPSRVRKCDPQAFHRC